MLFSTASYPRRLALLAVLVFVCTFLLLNRHPEYTHRIRSYAFTGAKPVDADGEVQLPIQETDGHKPGQVEDSLVEGPPKQPSRTDSVAIGSLSSPKPTNYLEGDITPIKHLHFADVQKFIDNLTDWSPLNTDNHWWLSWDAYRGAEYDPNRWEGFDWELGYFTKNGIKHLEERNLKPEVYLPYPAYMSAGYKSRWSGEWRACEGPRGKDLDQSEDDLVKAYKSPPNEFPEAAVGSAQVVGLDENACFDRFNRYGPYGLGAHAMNTPDSWTRPEIQPEWNDIKWGQLQDACLQRNKLRYAPEARAPMNLIPSKVQPANMDSLDETEAAQVRATSVPAYRSRTALLIRTFEGYSYLDNDLQAIRALVTELSLLSGGEYQVYLLVNVKDTDADVYSDPSVYQEVLKKLVPPELRDISLLWTERVVEEWYPKVGDWQVYWQQFMPLQWFSKTHPEFDYVWNWETDARYTGNHYHFLEKMADFSRNMPRKNLWERNSRFYFPAEHGNFASFLSDTDATIANATADGAMTPVWGPLPYSSEQVVTGPAPPHSYSSDTFTWGAGEEADLITLQPIWDPQDTEWSYRYKIWNFVAGKTPHFTGSDPGDDAYFHPSFSKIPRRVFINTVARFSKRMLHAMHLENRAGRAMQAEMWPATVALQHGLKAVYAPHPIWLDRKWPSWYLDAVFNADGGEAARWGQRKDSPYNHDREANFRGWSWYFASLFPRVLYRRWLGWSARDAMGDHGGRGMEDVGGTVPSGADGSAGEAYGGKGRMCLPGMLLHPVKKVKENDGDGGWVIGRAQNQDRIKEREIKSEVERMREAEGFYWGGDGKVKEGSPSGDGRGEAVGMDFGAGVQGWR